MSLTLTIIKSPNGIAQGTATKAFPDSGGSIGRGDNNSWVVPDPERFLSSRHCEIKIDGGQYYIVDLSTNGTFLNGASEPIGKGGREPLGSGDVFEIGEYQFRVSLEADAFAPAPFADSPFASNSPADDSYFPGSDAGSPFAEGVKFGEGLSLTPDSELKDPLQAFDEAGGGDPFTQTTQAPASFPIDDPFAGTASSEFKGGSFGDGADPLSQNVEWPSARQQNLIPDDWDDDFLGTGGPPSNPAANPHAQAPSKAVPRPAPADPRSGRVKKAQQEMKRPVRQEPSAGREPLAVREPPAKQVPPSKSQAGGKRPPSLVIDTLIEAMGMESKQFSDEQKREIGCIAGELMREVTIGMMQLLRSRTSLKNEFRMNVTTIQPIENNPLKFSANVDEALENMFVRQSSAYKKPVESFREGYQSIAEHQVAMIAGVRAAFESVMESFNPERMAKSFDGGKKGAGIPVVQKAKYWTAYTEHYQSLVENMEHAFQHLFGDDFVQAYEEQLSRLAAQRKNNT